jgi:hypothetical protein
VFSGKEYQEIIALAIIYRFLFASQGVHGASLFDVIHLQCLLVGKLAHSMREKKTPLKTPTKLKVI